DIDSTGLLDLTQDGRVARRLNGEESAAETEYLVRVAGELVENDPALLDHRLELDVQQHRPGKVECAGARPLRFPMREAHKREIRRMCELVGLRVVALNRIRIGRIALGDLPPGKWRFLAPDETF